ncbi:hypothetical protein KIP88_03090 [Bradyrhizobium sp. SRL28]|uniref:hypothetical protein n=1 Tax=Bradyrhizobium sp. SRL28 TaxID=2836178 RepID=UPI001BDE5CEA|nr:hypothetical protein [Bradyrhizobium sp. SRL28]MBT1509478.1 hypothetical protein [Bradyrhizobium sp. SRL28]
MMNIRQFLRTIEGLRSHRCCEIDGADNCLKRKVCEGCWWEITIRGGKTFVGLAVTEYDIDSEFFCLHRPPGDGDYLLTEILIEEIVAIAEIDKPSALPVEAPSQELTSLRKEVGRLYGIVKDMERTAA